MATPRQLLRTEGICRANEKTIKCLIDNGIIFIGADNQLHTCDMDKEVKKVD